MDTSWVVSWFISPGEGGAGEGYALISGVDETQPISMEELTHPGDKTSSLVAK